MSGPTAGLRNGENTTERRRTLNRPWQCKALVHIYRACQPRWYRKGISTRILLAIPVLERWASTTEVLRLFAAPSAFSPRGPEPPSMHVLDCLMEFTWYVVATGGLAVRLGQPRLCRFVLWTWAAPRSRILLAARLPGSLPRFSFPPFQGASGASPPRCLPGLFPGPLGRRKGGLIQATRPGGQSWLYLYRPPIWFLPPLARESSRTKSGIFRAQRTRVRFSRRPCPELPGSPPRRAAAVAARATSPAGAPQPAEPAQATGSLLLWLLCCLPSCTSLPASGAFHWLSASSSSCPTLAL